MKWLKERPDVRQRITSALTGLAPRAARNKAPEFQATLLDSVIEDGDINVQTFEHAFQPVELVAYGPVGAFWKLFRDKMPWRDESPAHRQLVEWIPKSSSLRRAAFAKNGSENRSSLPMHFVPHCPGVFGMYTSRST